jgi:hypothetical protein
LTKKARGRSYTIESKFTLDPMGYRVKLKVEGWEMKSTHNEQPSKILTSAIEIKTKKEAYPRTAKTYGGSRANSAMGIALPTFFAGNLVRIRTLAMMRRAKLKAGADSDTVVEADRTM